MNRSFRAQDSLMLDSVERQRQHLRASMMAEKEEELALFLEMRRREKDHDNLLNNPEEFETPLGSKPGTSPMFHISMAKPAHKKAAPDDFLESEGDKNDYEWLLTPPGTPLFPSLEIESHKAMLSQSNNSKARPNALNSRLSNSSTEPATRNSLASRQPTSSPGLSSSGGANQRRPSSSGGPGSRPATPVGRPTLTTNPRSSRASTPTSRAILPSTTRPSATNSTVSVTRTASASRATGTAARPTSTTARQIGSATKPTGSASRSTTSTTKPAGPSRSTTPLSRSTARSSTPTSRACIPPPKTISRSATPTRRSITSAAAPSTKPTISQVMPSSPVAKPSKIPPSPRGTSPTARSRAWKPSDMPGFSLETPPNLRTTLPDRPLSATRGRPGPPSLRSASVEPGLTGRPRRQSCSPSRGRVPMHPSGSSVPAVSRGYSKANDNVSPVVIGTKMVDRVINMRKLGPPRLDNGSSPHSNMSGKSSSPDSSGFGRTLSKKSLDMAIRHMDIRRTIPGNLRPLMTNIPASSMYSVRSGDSRTRTVSVSDSPLATSSNASSDISLHINNNNNNNGLLRFGREEEDVGSERGCR
ncbi:PREDICTED: mucin-17-like [Tarenaya hassleriana]|uniref:mucin-17-like n=1 Tax=Tarenaya hassleriana TaxID=28532 RepID=UPI00053C8D8F|nr:PREDICTED: mucin-17-like [Tarenaya hassleriana]